MEQAKNIFTSVVECGYCDGRFVVCVEDNVACCPRCATAYIIETPKRSV